MKGVEAVMGVTRKQKRRPREQCRMISSFVHTASALKKRVHIKGRKERNHETKKTQNQQASKVARHQAHFSNENLFTKAHFVVTKAQHFDVVRPIHREQRRPILREARRSL